MFQRALHFIILYRVIDVCFKCKEDRRINDVIFRERLYAVSLTDCIEKKGNVYVCLYMPLLPFFKQLLCNIPLKSIKWESFVNFKSIFHYYNILIFKSIAQNFMHVNYNAYSSDYRK